MPSSSRIVFAEDLPQTTPWRPGAIDGDRRGGFERRSPGARREDEVKGPTYEDGLRDGYERGLQQAREEGEAQRIAQAEAFAQRADALVAALTAQLAELQQGLAEEVTELAVEIARSAFGAALRVRDDAVAPAVVAALGALTDERSKPVLHLHPDDAVLVGEQLAPLLATRGVQIVPDDTIEPGGCRVHTVRASVDATVRTRWRRALAALGRDDDWVEA
jgi:flagellar assembly protein FliH